MTGLGSAPNDPARAGVRTSTPWSLRPLCAEARRTVANWDFACDVSRPSPYLRRPRVRECSSVQEFVG
jgi:hypothetical protein